MRDTITARLRAASADKASSPDRSPVTGDYDLAPELRRNLLHTSGSATRKLRRAAVLMPLIEHGSGMTVLLTQRTDHLPDHAGQIAFPGGRVEKSDKDIIDTALRETEEEVGIARQYIDVAGFLGDYETGTGFRVSPVVGFIQPGFKMTPDPYEVAGTFEVPLDFLMNPANHQLHKRIWNGVERQFYAMPYGDYYIWGATAGMIVSLYRAIHEAV